jgi:hypothetical protein
MPRICPYCGDPLPENAHYLQIYHRPVCARAVKLVKDLEYYYLHGHRPANKINVHVHKVNPMLRLGLDYVTLKLAGQIIIRSSVFHLHSKELT